VLRTQAGPRARALLINEHLDSRTRCDPIVLHGTAQRLCRALAARGDDAHVDVRVDAKRTTDPEMRPLMHVTDFCVRAPRYALLGHNGWISAE